MSPEMPNVQDILPDQTVASTGGGDQGGVGGAIGPDMGSADNTLTGDPWLKQFSPMVQSAVQNYHAGLSMPTGNPRSGAVQMIKMIAQKYGNDVGMPADDTTFTARRTMRNQLATGTPGSVGGQRNSGQVMLGHLDTVAQKMEDLGNWDTGMFPDIAHFVNYVREHGTTAQAAKVNGLNDAVQRYVAEVEKYYAGGVGAQSARDSAEKLFQASKTPAEFAAALQSERSLGESKLHTVDGQIMTTLGPQGAAQYPSMPAETRQHMKNIDAIISRLQGRSGPAAAAAPTAAAPAAPAPQAAPVAPGNYIYDPASKQLVPAK